MSATVSLSDLMAERNWPNIDTHWRACPMMAYHTHLGKRWLRIAIGGGQQEWGRTFLLLGSVVGRSANSLALSTVLLTSAVTALLSILVPSGLAHNGSTKQKKQRQPSSRVTPLLWVWADFACVPGQTCSQAA